MPSTEYVTRWKTDCHARFARQLRGVSQSRSNATTFGAASANELLPVVHVVGIALADAANAFQLGGGPSPPMQLTRASDPGNPVETSAVDNRFAGVKLRNSPMPPRSTPGVVPLKRPRLLPMVVLRTWPLRL